MTFHVVLSDTKTTAIDTQREILEEAGAEVENVTARTEDEVIEATADADALIVDSLTPVTAGVFEANNGLRVVGRAGIGVDNVDVEAAAANDVTVVHVPTYCVEEVSTHALALLLACVRKISRYDRSVSSGEWDWTVGQPIHRLTGQTIGIVAFGRIARRFAEKLSGFDVDLLAYDPYVDSDELSEHGIEKVEFDALLSRSDAISIHAPLTDETRHLFDTEAFRAMKDRAIVVNTARGPVIEADALYEALTEGEIAGAGLDVFETEPPEDTPLLELDSVVASPHAAWYSEESREELSRHVATDVRRVLSGEEPESPVDPESGWF